MTKRQCEFPIKVVKAYVEYGVGGEQRKHIVAIASDNNIDKTEEYFAESALEDMVKYSKQKKESKPSEGVVELRETHWSTFAIGWVADAWLVRKEEAITFFVDIILKDEYPAANELFKDIVDGVADKQLSVGGWIDLGSSDDAYDLEEVTIDGESTIIGSIKRFILEHIATTLPGWAANPNTEFLSAVVRSTFSPEFQKKISTPPLSNNSDADLKERSFSHLKKNLEDAVADNKIDEQDLNGDTVLVKEEDSEKWIKEVANKLGEYLKSIFSDNTEGKEVKMDLLEKAYEAGAAFKESLDGLNEDSKAEVLRSIFNYSEETEEVEVAEDISMGELEDSLETEVEIEDDSSIEKEDDSEPSEEDELEPVEKEENTSEEGVENSLEEETPEDTPEEVIEETPVEKTEDDEDSVEESVDVEKEDVVNLTTEKFKEFSDAIFKGLTSLSERIEKIENSFGTAKTEANEPEKILEIDDDENTNVWYKF